MLTSWSMIIKYLCHNITKLQKEHSVTKTYHVSTICNALVDVFLKATDYDIKVLDLNKGKMHLVDKKQQEKILQHFTKQRQAIELGGSALNLIKAMAQLNKKTFFAGVVSDDFFGSKIKNKLNELNIQYKLGSNSTESTGSCVILVTPDGERTLNTYLGASRLYDQSFIPSKDIAQSEIFHFSGYQWDTPDQKKGILKAIDVAKKNNCLLSFDLADPFVVERHREDFVKIIEKYADIVFANREESKLLYGLTPEDTASKINKHGATAVIKLDKEGALIKSTEQEPFIKIPVVKTKVIDTTGAGDMFAAGFLYGIVSKKSYERCGTIAAHLASDVISRYGAFLSEEIIEKIQASDY